MPSWSGAGSIPRGPRPSPAADVTRARAVFFGSGAFAVPVLEAVAGSAELELVAVVTAPPRPVGRRAVLAPTAVGAVAAGQWPTFDEEPVAACQAHAATSAVQDLVQDPCGPE